MLIAKKIQKRTQHRLTTKIQLTLCKSKNSAFSKSKPTQNKYQQLFY